MALMLEGKKMIRFQLCDSKGREVEELVAPQEAMAQLNISKSRISQLVSEGVLNKFPIGGQNYLLSKREVDAYALSDRKPGPKQARF
jgi:excisionase family DNA binding protein